MAFQRGADAEGDDRYPMLGADAHDLLHLLRCIRQGDGVRRLRRDVGGGVRMLGADRGTRLEALAEALLQDAEGRGDAGLVARHGGDGRERHVLRLLAPSFRTVYAVAAALSIDRPRAARHQCVYERDARAARTRDDARARHTICNFRPLPAAGMDCSFGFDAEPDVVVRNCSPVRVRRPDHGSRGAILGCARTARGRRVCAQVLADRGLLRWGQRSCSGSNRHPRDLQPKQATLSRRSRVVGCGCRIDNVPVVVKYERLSSALGQETVFKVQTIVSAFLLAGLAVT